MSEDWVRHCIDEQARLLNQLERFESGEMKLFRNGKDVTDQEMSSLRHVIANLEASIARDLKRKG